MQIHPSLRAPLLVILWPLIMGHLACTPARVGSTDTSARVRVPGGRFTAGLDESAQKQVADLCRSTSTDPEGCTPAIWHDEGQTVTLTLGDFEIDKFEVSQARYRACVSAGKCTAPEIERCAYPNGSRPPSAGWAVLGEAEHPVVCVTFAQAEAYCLWAGGRVPTEAQWERAARGADGRIFPWGNGWLPRALNWGDDGKVDGHALTAPVGSYPQGASPYGALDMVGNVWEWASRLPAFDADRWAGKQVIRGGGFAAAPHAQRTNKRAPYDPSQPYPNVGFRCVYGDVGSSPAAR